MGPRYCLLARGLTCHRLVAHSRLTQSLLVARPQQLCLMTLLHQPEVRSTSSLHGSWLLALKQKQVCKAYLLYIGTHAFDTHLCTPHSRRLLPLGGCACVEYESQADTASRTDGTITAAMKNQLTGRNTSPNTSTATISAVRLLFI